MKKQLVGFVKYFIFWMIFFLLAKALFLAWNYDQSGLLSIGEIAGIFGHGLTMDISTSCYLLLLPGMLLSYRYFISEGFINRFMYYYTLLFLILASLLMVLDLGLYPHWGTRVNVTIFNYIDDLVSLKASFSLMDILQALVIIASFVSAFLFLYKKLFAGGFVSSGTVKWYLLPVQLFFTVALILPIRGGLDTSPMNLSSVAFSPKMYVNQAACNYMWNFAKSVEKRKRLTNPCLYMDAQQSVKIFNDSRNEDSLSVHPQLIRLTPGKQPNVVLVILESFSNKVIAQLGGLHDVAPNVDSLCTKSTVFTNYYSTGNRSDRGISAILGGYPSLLSTSIMVYPEKSNTLTLLPEYFNRKNYNTSFYYGGDINFYNLKTFVLQGKYKKLVTKSDFPSELGSMSKWGVPDGYIFKKAAEDLKTEQEPFMKTIYTISSHPPFDVPFSKIKGSGNREMYLNAVAYTDSCLGEFVKALRQSPVWNNTLLIVTADHGTNQPGPTDITDPASYRIPLIWSGGVVDSLRRIETITQQVDLGTTLIHQLGWKTDHSPFTKDFFTLHPYAFFMHDSGWGYVLPQGCFYFDLNTNQFTTKEGTDQSVDWSFAKSYMQVLHDDFIKR
ncbi:MAG: LTA synthase family protein [Candidatus Saccharibacteria bacterium]